MPNFRHLESRRRVQSIPLLLPVLILQVDDIGIVGPFRGRVVRVNIGLHFGDFDFLTNFLFGSVVYSWVCRLDPLKWLLQLPRMELISIPSLLVQWSVFGWAIHRSLIQLLILSLSKLRKIILILPQRLVLEMVGSVNILVACLWAQYLIDLLFRFVIQGLGFSAWCRNSVFIRWISVIKILFMMHLLIEIGRKHALQFLIWFFISYWSFP